MVDFVARHELLSFLDAFSGYNQIMLAKKDRLHTYFVTEYGSHQYKLMPFRLKNISVTYKRMVIDVFKPLMGTMI